MQTRMDAESLFIQTESEARLSEIRSTKSQGKRVVNCILNQNQESELQIKQTRARQNQNRYQRVVIYNFSIDWLTSNQHRIKINVLRGTDRLSYTVSVDRLENRIAREQVEECSKLVSQSGIEQ